MSVRKTTVLLSVVCVLATSLMSSGCSVQTPLADEMGSSSAVIASLSQQNLEDEPTDDNQLFVSEEDAAGFIAYLSEEYPNWDPDATYEYDPDYRLSDDELASLIEALQTSLFEAEDGSVQKGYVTDSTELEVSGAIPNYYLKEDGTIDEETVGKYFIVYDDGHPVAVAQWSAWEAGFDANDSSTIHALTLEGRDWKGGVTTTLLARLNAGATQLAFVSGSDETLLLDGDTLYETEFVLPAYGWHPLIDSSGAGLDDDVDLRQFIGGHQSSNGTPVDLTGLQYGSVEPRQTFGYQAP